MGTEQMKGVQMPAFSNRLSCVLGLVWFVGGCCAGTEDRPRLTAIEPASDPSVVLAAAPTVFDMKGTLVLKVPADTAKQIAAPQSLNATLELHSKAESISSAPRRSKYAATVAIHIIDPTNESTRFDFETEISGERDGSPSDAEWNMLGKLLNAIEIMSKSTSASTTRPAR